MRKLFTLTYWRNGKRLVENVSGTWLDIARLVRAIRADDGIVENVRVLGRY